MIDLILFCNSKVGFPERVYEVISWLTLPEEEKPDFITLYFDEPDHAGHGGGPESEGVSDQLQNVDDMLSRLMDTLYHKGLHNCVNIVIIADHGRTIIIIFYMVVFCKLLSFLRTYITISAWMILILCICEFCHLLHM